MDDRRKNAEWHMMARFFDGYDNIPNADLIKIRAKLRSMLESIPNIPHFRMVRRFLAQEYETVTNFLVTRRGASLDD